MEHLLFEHVAGFELFELKEFEKLAGSSYNDYMALTQVVTHVSSLPITESAEVISELKNLQEGNLSEPLKNFLQINNVKLLNCDKSMKNALQNIGITQKTSQNISRGIRFNLKKLIKQDCNRQLILGASHLLAKENIKYNLEREDNVVIATGYEVEHLEMEIGKLNEKSAKLLNWYLPNLKEMLNQDTESILNLLDQKYELIGNKISEENLEEIKDSLKDIPQSYLAIMKSTLNVIKDKKVLLNNLENYLADKMTCLAPNLREILGDRLSFKLIHKAGGMMNLCLYPSSTLQLLGAEKSLFRSLKIRSNTPKHGLIYHLDYLQKHQGKMCRSIAAKCSLAARIDCFSENRTNIYGKELRALIDKKLKSYKLKTKVETSGDLLARVYEKLNKKEKKNIKTVNPDKTNILCSSSVQEDKQDRKRVKVSDKDTKTKK